MSPTRRSNRTPGHDCGWRGEKCQHKVKGEHGISGGFYFYSVVADEGDVAVVFTVHAPDYPETIEEPRRSRCIQDMISSPLCFYHVHAAFPLDRDQVGTKPEKCDALPGGVCYGDGGHYAGPEKILIAHGRPGEFEQPEAFWLELERILEKQAAWARAGRADRIWKVCPSCGGTDHPGFIEIALPALQELRTEIKRAKS